MANTVYPACWKWLIVSLFLVILVNFTDCFNEQVGSIITAIYTGIIASVFVAVFIQKKQDEIILNKKKAMLFDAFFLLKRFVDEYYDLKNYSSVDWINKYQTCEEVSVYLCDLYRYHKDIFDVTELQFLRVINSKIFFIKRTLNVDNDDREEFMKSDEKVVEIDKRYNDLVNELIENLFHLIIKWNLDGITNIDLDKNSDL